MPVSINRPSVPLVDGRSIPMAAPASTVVDNARHFWLEKGWRVVDLRESKREQTENERGKKEENEKKREKGGESTLEAESCEKERRSTRDT
eukprot:840053-Rhodomonas_salina.1